MNLNTEMTNTLESLTLQLESVQLIVNKMQARLVQQREDALHDERRIRALNAHEARPTWSDITRQVRVFVVTKPNLVVGFDYLNSDCEVEYVLKHMMIKPSAGVNTIPSFTVHIEQGDKVEQFLTYIKKGSTQSQIRGYLNAMIADGSYKQMVI